MPTVSRVSATSGGPAFAADRSVVRAAFTRATWVTTLLVMIALLGCAYLFFISTAGRFVFGIATVVITNESANSLCDVRLVITDGKGNTTHAALGSVNLHKSVTLRLHANEVYVNHVEYWVDGNRYSHAIPGIVCRGETLVIRIKGAELHLEYDR